MRNKLFLDMMVTCGKLKSMDINFYNILCNSELDLKEYFDYVKSLVSASKIDDMTPILDNLLKVLSRVDYSKDCVDYIEDYKRFLKVRYSVSNQKSLELLNTLTNNYDIKLEPKFYDWKKMPIDYSTVVNLHQGSVLIKHSDYNGLQCLEINKEFYSAIFIKDNIEEYIKASDLMNVIKVLHRIITEKDSYDFVIYPILLSSQEVIHKCYLDNYEVNNQEYLELLRFVDYGFSTFSYEQYENIYYSDINIVKLMEIFINMLREDISESIDILYLGSRLISTLIDKYKPQELIDKACEILEAKNKILKYESVADYLLYLSNQWIYEDLISSLSHDTSYYVQSINLDKKFEVYFTKILHDIQNNKEYKNVNLVIYKDKTYKILSLTDRIPDKQNILTTIYFGEPKGDECKIIW